MPDEGATTEYVSPDPDAGHDDAGPAKAGDVLHLDQREMLYRARGIAALDRPVESLESL
jgi:hypothetical protein